MKAMMKAKNLKVLIEATKKFLSISGRRVCQQDEIFWRHADCVVIKELGLEFKPENYDELEGFLER